jgi:hypothetical protein
MAIRVNSRRMHGVDGGHRPCHGGVAGRIGTTRAWGWRLRHVRPTPRAPGPGEHPRSCDRAIGVGVSDERQDRELYHVRQLTQLARGSSWVFNFANNVINGGRDVMATRSTDVKVAHHRGRSIRIAAIGHPAFHPEMAAARGIFGLIDSTQPALNSPVQTRSAVAFHPSFLMRKFPMMCPWPFQEML